MPKLGINSTKKLAECHPDLIRLVEAVAAEFNLTVMCGFRGVAEQEAAFKAGVSKAHFGESPHNSVPSMAVDIAPYPIDWRRTDRFAYLAGCMRTKAKELGIAIRWGGDWNGDFELKDNNFNDLPHFELVGWKKA